VCERETADATTATSLARFAGDPDDGRGDGSGGDRGGDAGATLGDLRRTYRRLLFEELPEQARREGWPVVDDHCIARVVLDATVGDVWSDHLDRPAVRNLPPEGLRAAVDVARSLATGGRERAVELNRRSLRYRGTRGDGAGDGNDPGASGGAGP
jgi:hypothetical protein